MPLFAAKGMSASGGGGNFYTLVEAKRANLNDASYRKPSGMFDVATSSSGEVYTLNGERNPLTGLYNAVIAKFGSIGSISWQYTISSAKNCYPCALGCYQGDNSVYIIVMETTDLSGANNYNAKRANETNSTMLDSTHDAVYRFIKFTSSGTRVWENTYSSSNSTLYPCAISQVTQGTASHSYSNVFTNRNHDSNIWHSLVGAPDLQLNKVVAKPGRTSPTDNEDWNHETSNNVISSSDSIAVLGVTDTGYRSYEMYSTDGPHFGGRPQATSNICMDDANLCFYVLVAANATTTDMSRSRSTMNILKVPLTGVSINAREIVFPGGWDQNAKLTMDSDGKLLIPWTSTTKERQYHNQSLSTASGDVQYYRFYDTGDPNNATSENLGSYIRYDFTATDFDLTTYATGAVAPPKVCKVEPEPTAEGTTYEYVTTAGLQPSPNAELGGANIGRDNVGDGHKKTGRYNNFVQLHKSNKGTGALDWVRTFFAIPHQARRDQSNNTQDGAGSSSWDAPTVNTPDIMVADTKVFSNGIYYVGNVVFNTGGLPNASTYTNKNSYIGWVAKINFDGTIDYIREVRSLVDNVLEYTNNNPGDFPPYYYQAEQNGGVLLDSINFDAFNNMIITGRHVSDSNVGASGHFIDNVVFKLPHNGDLIGPIVVRDLFPPVGTTDLRLRRFTYTPATLVRCWEDVIFDANINYSTAGRETYKILRCCALWNDNHNWQTTPTSVGATTTLSNYQALLGISPDRLVTLDSGTFSGRLLWQTPTTFLQLDTTGTRAWDRAERRQSSNIFLQTFEESDAASMIEAQASCPAYLYVDQTVNTDNAQTDFDAVSYSKLLGDGSLEDSRIKKQEHPNGIITVSQYYDGSGLRKQLLSRHTPTGGIETRMYDTGFNTYPKDVVIDEIGNIYTVGWTADTGAGNNYGVGYVTCYDKTMTFQWDYRFVNNDSTSLVDAADNFQIHCAAVTVDGANTAKLFIGGHYTSVNAGTPTQHGIVSCIPLTLAGTGLPTVVSTSNAGTSVEIGAAQSNNAIDGIFGLDVFQMDAAGGSILYVGYAGKLYDTTGATTRGTYGIIEYAASTPDIVVASNSSGYIIGDELELSSFSFRGGVDDYQGISGNTYGMYYAVGGKETQSGDTNGVVLVCNTEQTLNGQTSWTTSYDDHPYSITSFVINNSNGADVVKDLRWGFVEVPGVNKTKAAMNDSSFDTGNDHNRFNDRLCWNDRLWVTCAITNQYSQIDTYIVEITSANLTIRSDGGNNNVQNKTPDAANITRAGKLSTSGITDPGGIVINGPELGTIMVAATSANSGTPNDRQLLTCKVPMDMSKADSSYRDVGSQFVYWDEPDFSLNMQGKFLMNAEFNVNDSSNYRDGTRFIWTTDGMVGELMAFASPTQLNDISGVGTFTSVTKDLQAYKQS